MTTNALGQTATEVLDPGRGSVLSLTDPAGYLTTATYDPLGRLTAVWKPGRSQAGGATASVTYSYPETQSAPLAVTTNTLVDYGTGTNYLTSISIFDSMGQLRQTQAAAEGGNTVVTDTFYDSHGWVAGTDNKYVVVGQPVDHAGARSRRRRSTTGPSRPTTVPAGSSTCRTTTARRSPTRPRPSTAATRSPRSPGTRPAP